MSLALVLGGASCLWTDLAALAAIGGYATRAAPSSDFAPQGTGTPLALEDWPGIVVAVNDAGVLYPGRVDHWVSLHANKLGPWKLARERRGGNMDFLTWGHETRQAAPVDRVLPLKPPSGSSGLHAVRVAQHLHCPRVVCCGVPMTHTGHAHDPRLVWDDFARYRAAWEQGKAGLADVRSMSGWTQELLGAPTREWLEGADAAACQPARTAAED